MTIYCDESGGLNAGAMTFAAVMLTPQAAADIHERFRSVTGLRGELKGSRISMVERAYLLELVDRAGGRAWVAAAHRDQLAQAPGGTLPSDLALYGALLNSAVGHWLPETGGECTDVVIDDGRYDPKILSHVREEVQAGLGNWGRASLADSKRSDGVQIADVIANSLFNITVKSPRAHRIERIIEPMLASKAIRVAELTRVV
ncbi:MULTISPECIES: DUF3800 domain-containing protein [unclassified Sphingopyxis]|uniref:DUF3800 domain-containing protein n=1 Tax=unclassified Sphingopyxis TaxID=2614943 RepID=UPI000736F8C6|nr:MULTISPECIES: DUF3800 domain-containing protein [unclassified Sphingopyxis]KTE41453.1 hypothetical protein ATE62_06160 [Sphingopyxis sp. HIX]KTE83985.1 hypothetical protein ATE72_10940 [Sphingopyxis sp. HXXIV]